MKTLKDLKPAEYNPRIIEEKALNGLKASIASFGDLSGITFNKNTGNLVSGHQRVKALQEKYGDLEIEKNLIKTPDGNEFKIRIVDWPVKKEKAANVAVNNPLIAGEFTADILPVLDEIKIEFPEEFEELNFDGLLEDLNFDIPETEYESSCDEDEVPEVETKEPITKRGDLWELGKHRLLCGDSTVIDDVEKLMGEEKACLLHCDPPYGMGKEKDGVLNDNLYKEKLDKFQMGWFIAAFSFLKNNASVYIWGNAEDLWRLWYVGGLKDFKRFTFRNEIVWNKGTGQGQLSDKHRMFPTASERCLFFMLGEQGFNTNADNYWDGWEPIRQYLKDERLKMGWDIPTMKRIVGHSDLNRDHWTDKSQWSMIPEYCYMKLQEATKGDAFKKSYDELKKSYDELKKSYDELKKEFYSTRAYFNNAHECMTDVWEYSPVLNEDRCGHPTPKPVNMLMRAIKSSSPKNSVVLDLFGGSGSTLIACEKTGRKARLMEIDEHYCDVSVLRYVKFAGDGNIKLNGREVTKDIFS